MGFLGDIKSALSIAKNLQDPRLMEHLTNLQTVYMEAQERIRELEKENETLQQKLSVKHSLIVQNRMYFTKPPNIESEETSFPVDGPFCTRCYDADDKLVRLIDDPQDKYAHCPQCGTGYDYSSKPPGPEMFGSMYEDPE